MKHDLKLLEKLCMAFGVSGSESGVLDVVKNELAAMKVSYTQLPFGDVVCGQMEKPELLLAAHADEVGFHVKGINDDGTLRVVPVGLVNPHMLNEVSVVVQTKNSAMVMGQGFARVGLLSGTVPSFAAISVDVGTESAAATRRLGISEGDAGTYQKKFWTTKSTVFSSALDNRISVYLLLQMIRNRPSSLQHVAYSFQTQEETNFSGLKGVVNTVSPEMVLSVDMFPAHHEFGSTETQLRAGDGPAVLYQVKGGVIAESLKRFLSALPAGAFRIMSSELPEDEFEPFAVMGNGRTAATNVFLPVRGYHSSVSSVRLGDVDKTFSLIQSVIALLRK
jgi:endoglucanase